MHGFVYNSLEAEFILYADDPYLLLISGPQSSTPVLIEILGDLSGYLINLNLSHWAIVHHRVYWFMDIQGVPRSHYLSRSIDS